jgi:predicted CXXCH cytochrome family protein
MTASSIILAAALFAVSPDSGNIAHNSPLMTPCIECHTRLPFSGGAPPLRSEVDGICITCHLKHHGVDAIWSHPVDIVPSMRIPPDMVLDKRRRVVCVTCHAFHGEYRDESGNKRFYLRRSPGKAFCYSCHKKL